eukprot:7540114-Ditylum_brightwellii.AAC.1
MLVTIQQSKNEGLDNAVLALRKYDRVILSRRAKKRKLKNTICRMIDSNEISVDSTNNNDNDTRCFKKSRMNKSIGKSEVNAWVNDQGYLSMNKKGFKNMTTKD